MVVIYWSLLFWLTGFSGSAIEEPKGVQWQEESSFSQFSQGSFDKPIIVDVYTDWCHYCKLMDATAWRHEKLSEYVNSNFIPIKFNAESKDSLQWMGKKFGYQARYKVHMLAVELLGGNMVYPSTVIIPPRGEIQVLRGAYKAKELELVLRYYGSGSYKTLAFTDFQRQFRGTW